MKTTSVHNIAITDKHKYEGRTIFDLEKVTAYDVEFEDEEIETITVYFDSGKNCLFEAIAFEKGILSKLLESLEDHFFPERTDPYDIDDKGVEFYYY